MLFSLNLSITDSGTENGLHPSKGIPRKTHLPHISFVRFFACNHCCNLLLCYKKTEVKIAVGPAYIHWHYECCNRISKTRSDFMSSCCGICQANRRRYAVKDTSLATTTIWSARGGRIRVRQAGRPGDIWKKAGRPGDIWSRQADQGIFGALILWNWEKEEDSQKYKYILVIIDNFSKWTTLRPLKTKRGLFNDSRMIHVPGHVL